MQESHVDRPTPEKKPEGKRKRKTEKKETKLENHFYGCLGFRLVLQKMTKKQSCTDRVSALLNDSRNRQRTKEGTRL